MKVYPAIKRLGLVLSCCLLLGGAAWAQEICDNGIDDDADGLVDLNDSDCDCQMSDLLHLANAGFEAYSSLPTAISQMNRALNWHQATYGTSDYFNTAPGGFAPPGIPLPLPSGTGFAGFTMTQGGMENIGTCLQYPLLPGVPYTLSFHLLGGRYGGADAHPPVPAYSNANIHFYGLTSCPSFPHPGTNDCPFAHGYVDLGSINYASTFTWQAFTLNITPADTIRAIILGGECVPPTDFTGSAGGYPYFWVDELQLSLAPPFVTVQISEEGWSCASVWELRAQYTHQPDAFQWYRDGVALLGQTAPRLDLQQPGLGAGQYQVRLSYPAGCVLAQTTVLDNPPDSLYVRVLPSRCQQNNGSISIDSVRGGQPPYSYSLNGAPWSSQQAFFELNAGQYQLQTRDANGCVLTRDVAVPNEGLAISGLQLRIAPELCYDSLGSLLIEAVVDGTPPYLFGLSPGNLGTDSLFELSSGRYQLWVRDAMGCTYERAFEVPDSCILPPCTLFAPNAFTPNNDALNDRFFITPNCELEEMLLQVYNRWGELVYETRDPNAGWDGRFRGEDCANGAYAYVFVARTQSQPLFAKGSVMLLR